MNIKINSKGKKLQVIIDKEDYEKISKFTWWVKQNNYIYTNTQGRINRTSIYLHRLIMDAPKGLEVDHINHNPLDNRKENLRVCTKSQNNINKTNIYSGVTKFRNKWRARIKINKKETHIGIFETKEEALKKRIEKEIELFANFSKHYEHNTKTKSKF